MMGCSYPDEDDPNPDKYHKVYWLRMRGEEEAKTERLKPITDLIAKTLPEPVMINPKPYGGLAQALADLRSIRCNHPDRYGVPGLPGFPGLKGTWITHDGTNILVYPKKPKDA